MKCHVILFVLMTSIFGMAFAGKPYGPVTAAEANYHFDPNFKTPEEIAIEQAAEEKARAERETQATAEEERLRIEAERLKREKELQLIEKLKQDPPKALHQAILNNSEVEIKHAVMAGANVNLGIGKQPPIGLALMLGKTEAVKALLENGAKANITFLNQPIVIYALKNGQIKDALSLIKNGASFSGEIDGIDVFTYVSKNFNSFTPGQRKQINFDLMYEMIKQGYDLKKNFNNKDLCNNAWYIAIKNNQNNHILFFLNKYPDCPLPYTADINQIFSFPDGATDINLNFTFPAGATVTPVFLSLKIGTYFTQFDYFFNEKTDVKKKAKPDGEKLQSLLSYALEMNTISVIDFLIKHGESLAAAIDLFIKNGGCPDYTFNPNCTLLGLAVAYNDIDAVKTLLSAGASINYPTGPAICVEKNIKGCHTPLYYALQNVFGDIIELLLKHGATL